MSDRSKYASRLHSAVCQIQRIQRKHDDLETSLAEWQDRLGSCAGSLGAPIAFNQIGVALIEDAHCHRLDGMSSIKAVSDPSLKVCGRTSLSGSEIFKWRRSVGFMARALWAIKSSVPSNRSSLASSSFCPAGIRTSVAASVQGKSIDHVPQNVVRQTVLPFNYNYDIDVKQDSGPLTFPANDRDRIKLCCVSLAEIRGANSISLAGAAAIVRSFTSAFCDLVVLGYARLRIRRTLVRGVGIGALFHTRRIAVGHQRFLGEVGMGEQSQLFRLFVRIHVIATCLGKVLDLMFVAGLTALVARRGTSGVLLLDVVGGACPFVEVRFAVAHVPLLCWNTVNARPACAGPDQSSYPALVFIGTSK
jgi:hypothetical protein